MFVEEEAVSQTEDFIAGSTAKICIHRLNTLDEVARCPNTYGDLLATSKPIRMR